MFSKSIVVFFSVFMIGFTNYAQNLAWAKSFSGSSGDIVNSSVVDKNGNIITTGYFNDTVDFDPGPGVFNLVSSGSLWGEIFICKLNATGNLIWAKSMQGRGGNSGAAVTVDTAGNVYTAGYFVDTVDFDPGIGVSNLMSFGNTDVFVSKLDANGNFVWVKQLGGPNVDRVYGISIDQYGNVITCGNFFDTGDFDPGIATYSLTNGGGWDIFLSKLDLNGNFIWAKGIVGLGFQFASSMSLDTTGSIIITGLLDQGGPGDFDPGSGVFNLVAIQNTDVFVAKYRSSGDFVWAKRIGGMGYDYGICVTSDVQGNVYTGGNFQLTPDFNPGNANYTITAVAAEDGFITKLDSTGNFIWAKSFGGLAGQSINVIRTDLPGNIYVTGQYNGTFDADPGPGSQTFSCAGMTDFFFCKLNAAGNYIDGFSLGSSYVDIAQCMNLDPLGNLYLAGRFDLSFDFDPGPSTQMMTSEGTDIFVMKFCQVPETNTIFGNSNICLGSATSFSVYNTPGSSYVWSLPINWVGSSVTSSINVIPNNSGGTISVSGMNSCGISTQTMNLSIIPLPVVLATVDQSSICAGESVILTSSGASTYTWSNSQTGDSIVVSPPSSCTIVVIGTDTNHCEASANLQITVNECLGLQSPIQIARKVNLYPNPTSSYLQLELISETGSNFKSYQIYNSMGQKVFEDKIIFVNSSANIYLNDLTNGIYTLKMVDSNSEMFSERFIVYR